MLLAVLGCWLGCWVELLFRLSGRCVARGGVFLFLSGISLLFIARRWWVSVLFPCYHLFVYIPG